MRAQFRADINCILTLDVLLFFVAHFLRKELGKTLLLTSNFTIQITS
jgi:hypothetical protein